MDHLSQLVFGSYKVVMSHVYTKVSGFPVGFSWELPCCRDNVLVIAWPRKLAGGYCSIITSRSQRRGDGVV